MKKQAINHIAIQPEPLEEPPSPDMSSVTYYVRDANEAVMAMYHQTAHHASGPLGCLRKPNNGGVDMEMDGLVENPWNCDNCRVGMLGGLPGGEWNPWQEDYDGNGVGDACAPCPYKGTLGDPCAGPEKFPQAEVWSGTAVVTKLAELPIYGSASD